jgi:hypothetical protein
MAAPTRNLFDQRAGSTSYTPDVTNVQTGALAGDCVCLFMATDGNPTLTLTQASIDAGWQLVTQIAASSNAAKAAHLRYMVMEDGVVPAPTINLSASESFTSQFIRLRPSAPGNQINFLNATTAIGSSTNPNPAAIINNTGSAKDLLYIVMFGGDANVASTAAPANYANHQPDTISNSANGCAIATADRTRLAVANAGSEDPGTFTRATEQWATITIAAYEVTPTAVNFTSQNISTGAPVISQSSVGQIHALNSGNVTTSAAAISQAAMSQTHILASLALATAAATLSVGGVIQQHILTSNNIIAGVPVIQPSAATVIITYNLTSLDLITSAPAIGSASVTQAYAITSQGLATAAPAISVGAVGQTHALASLGLVTASPALQASAIGQTHALGSLALATGVPALSATVLGQVHALASAGIVTFAPALSQSALSGTAALLSQNISTDTPVLSSSIIGQTHGINSQNIATNVPVISVSGSSIIIQIASFPITGGLPEISSGSLGQVYSFNSLSIETQAPVISLSFASEMSESTFLSQDITAGIPNISQSALLAYPLIPAERVITIPLENRTIVAQSYMVDSNHRTIIVPFENRTIVR